MSFIPNAVSARVGRLALQLDKVSPKVLFVGGLVGFAATVVLASRATLKVDDVIVETDEWRDSINNSDRYANEDERRKDKITLYVHSSVKIAKLYLPSLAVAAVSVAMLTKSHSILSKRNVALTAAYSAIEKGFQEYRERVVKDVGVEKDREYLHGVETEKVTVVDSDGKKKQVKSTFATANSPYGVMFNASNRNFQHDYPDHNYLFLRGQQNYMNDLLQSRGHVLLNDVYDAIGVPRTKAGCVVGWLRGNADDVVDFGIFDDAAQLRVHKFMMGQEGELYLDFNVDGLIFEKL